MLPPDAASGPTPDDADADANDPPAENSPPETLPTTTPSTSSAGQRRRIRGPIGFLAAAIVVVFAGSGLFVAGFALGSQTTNQPGTPADAAADFQPFWDTYAAISEHYAGEPVDRKQLVQGAIKGMLAALGDPFSFYMSPADFQNSLQGLSGQFEGIGASITSRATDGTEGCTPLGPSCALIVVAPIPDSPADRAGVKAGDRIVKIDGTAVDGAAVDATLARVRGPKGTVVTLTVVRGSAAPTDLAITRDVIVQPEVVAKDLAGGRVGYIKVSGFSDNATSQFVAALTKDMKAGRKLIVLDLRGNPGGFVTSARTIASQFIGSGPIFWEQAANAAPIATPALTDGVATDPGIKLAVLVDKDSASASEIVAGALQDTKRGTLVGQQTYGKGTIQAFLPLDEDTGGFRLTIARWLTPDQHWIHKVGLTPDVVVPVPAPGSVPAGADPVLDRALQVLGVGAAARAGDFQVAA